MSSELDAFDWPSEQYGQVRRIKVLDGPDEAHFQFIDDEWTPALQLAQSQARLAFRSLPPEKRKRDDVWRKIEGKFGAPDSHWNWRAKASTGPIASNRVFVLVDGVSVEAAMQFRLDGVSRLVKTTLQPIIYVDHIAVAPWNRPAIQTPVRFKRLGSLMLNIAITVSHQEGCDGRCGLHSLIQAEGFYRQAGMTDCGCERPGALRYFEFEPDAARKFSER